MSNLSLKAKFENPSTGAGTNKKPGSHSDVGRRIPFNGDPAIPFPGIGNVYLVADYGEKENGSIARPMILVGYYMHKGKTVALDFIKPTSSIRSSGDYDSDRYAILLENYHFGDFRPVDLKIVCDTIVTLPNNKKEILRPSPFDKVPAPLLADYLLRRALVLYEKKARWKKDALIPDGAVRYGLTIEGIDQSQCMLKDRYVPDINHKDHNFSQVPKGPRFITDKITEIITWACKAHILLHSHGVRIPLPALNNFPNWKDPASSRLDQAGLTYDLNT